jgi:hypothetical protein
MPTKEATSVAGGALQGATRKDVWRPGGQVGHVRMLAAPAAGGLDGSGRGAGRRRRAGVESTVSGCASRRLRFNRCCRGAAVTRDDGGVPGRRLDVGLLCTVGGAIGIWHVGSSGGRFVGSWFKQYFSVDRNTIHSRTPRITKFCPVGHCQVSESETARRQDGRCDDYQKAVDGFWASWANSRHATNRAASCLR